MSWRQRFALLRMIAVRSLCFGMFSYSWLAHKCRQQLSHGTMKKGYLAVTPLKEMGNSNVGQPRARRLKEALHSSIEASLRSDAEVPSSVFTQLYLEAEQLQQTQEDRAEKEDDDEEKYSEPSSATIPCQLRPHVEEHCRLDGFCQSGKDLRLESIGNTILEVPPGFILVGATSPRLPDNILVCAVDHMFLPDSTGQNSLLGFLGNCVGCGKKGFRYFTEFSEHINLKTGFQPKKQTYLQYYLLRDSHGRLVRGPAICWESREAKVQSSQCVSHPMSRETEHLSSQKPSQQLSHMSPSPGESTSGTQMHTRPPKKRHKEWPAEGPGTADPQ